MDGFGLLARIAWRALSSRGAATAATLLAAASLGACASGHERVPVAEVLFVDAPTAVVSLPGPVRLLAATADAAGDRLFESEVVWHLLASDGATPLGAFVGSSGSRLDDPHLARTPVDRKTGEAWVDVAGGGEGTVRVLARGGTDAGDGAPAQVMTTIHWVDLDWEWTVDEAPEGVSTRFALTVTRASDGKPVSGYLVDARVVDGPGVFDHGGSRRIARSGADGRVLVDVIRGAGAGETADVEFVLIRPADPARGWTELLIERAAFRSDL